MQQLVQSITDSQISELDKEYYDNANAYMKIFEANKLYPVSLKLHSPASPHQTLKLPTLEVWFAKK